MNAAEERLEGPNQYSRGFEDGEAFERVKTEQIAREAWIAVQGDDENFDLWFQQRYGSGKQAPTEAAIVIPAEILDKVWEEEKPKESSLTTDPNDPDLKRGVDETPVPQNKKYLVLSEEERAKGFVRPVRNKYIHTVCGGETKMGDALSETYARDPKFYGATYCVHCQMHKPVSEFKWSNTDEEVGS